MSEAKCDDCGRRYGEENGFPDLIIPQEAWNAISPTDDEGGLLCPCCIVARLYQRGIRTEGAFASMSIESVTFNEMNYRRRLENIEMALLGRMNRWGAALRERVLDVQDPERIKRRKVLDELAADGEELEQGPIETDGAKTDD